MITAPLMAQQGASAGPASPSPAVSMTPATDATPLPVAEPTPAASPSAQPEPSPEASPSASPDVGEDVIPLPPESGPAETPIVSETEVPNLAKPGENLPDSAFADPDAVIPSDSASLPPTSSGPSPQEIERKLKVRYQEVRVQVEKDPAVRSLMEQSKAAKSFEDERAALREYYRLLFKKIKKVDKDLTARCDSLEQAYIARLAQMRVEPTIPLNPPPTPAPLSE
ncbi:MAG: hypothetical protein M0Q93_05260 [Terrimicrobiaceae bacterium]|nr:hypothetical protein [Terrimicrobiaceae bacterium]